MQRMRPSRVFIGDSKLSITALLTVQIICVSKIHSYIRVPFKDSKVMTVHKICLPLTIIIFHTHKDKKFR